MSIEQVPASLRELLADVFEISPEQVTPELNMERWITGIRSGTCKRFLPIEGEYGVQFDPQRIPELTSVALLQAELVKKGAAL